MQREHSTGNKPIKWRLRLNRRNPGIKVSGLRRPVSANRLTMLIFLAGNQWLI